MMWDDGGWTAGSWIVMSLTMAVFWGGVAVLVAWLVHTLRPGNGPAPGAGTALASAADEVLAQRFALGEIDEEEYTRRRAALQARR
jgi:putative membrane protein